MVSRLMTHGVLHIIRAIERDIEDSADCGKIPVTVGVAGGVILGGLLAGFVGAVAGGIAGAVIFSRS